MYFITIAPHFVEKKLEQNGRISNVFIVFWVYFEVAIKIINTLNNLASLSLLLFVFCGSLSSVFAQKPDADIKYNTEESILYRIAGVADDYILERCKIDLYYPENKKGFQTVVWFHGGGLTGGEKYIPEELKGKGLAVAAVNYRLSPGVEATVCIEDAAAAIAWVFEHIEEYGGNPGKIFTAGHSAGGYLVAMTALDKTYLASHGVDADQIAGVFDFSGHAVTHMTIREERGIEKEIPVVDQWAPLYHIRKDAPMMVLITGDRDRELLGRYEENAYFYRMMKVVGNEQIYLHELGSFDHGQMVVPGAYVMLNYLVAMK